MDDLNQVRFNLYQQPGTSKVPQPGGHHVTFAMPEYPPPREANLSNPGPIRRRRFSAAKIQPTRIKKVMQSDEEIGRMVASVPVAIGRAMEHFAEKFLLASAAVTQQGNCRTLTPAHMRLAIAQNPHFRFLENVFKDGPGGVPAAPQGTANRPTDLAGGSSIPLAAAWKDQLTMSSPLSPATTGVPTVQAQEITPTSPMVTASMGTFSINAGSVIPITSPMAMSSYPMMSDPVQMTSPVDSIPLSDGGVQVIPVKSNIDMPEKPKRGRPRKVKKADEKCLDEELCREVTDNIVKEDKDRELMPPPSLPMGVMARSRTKQLA